METIHIRKKIESETLHLPELKSLIGKPVEIVVQDVGESDIKPGTDDWDTALKAVQELEDYDFEALRDQRDFDLRHAGQMFDVVADQDEMSPWEFAEGSKLSR